MLLCCSSEEEENLPESWDYREERDNGNPWLPKWPAASNWKVIRQRPQAVSRFWHGVGTLITSSVVSGTLMAFWRDQLHRDVQTPFWRLRREENGKRQETYSEARLLRTLKSMNIFPSERNGETQNFRKLYPEKITLRKGKTDFGTRFGADQPSLKVTYTTSMLKGVQALKNFGGAFQGGGKRYLLQSNVIKSVREQNTGYTPTRRRQKYTISQGVQTHKKSVD